LKASSSSRAISSARGASAQGISYFDEKPNGFDKVVNRMKNFQKVKEKQELEQYKIAIGERFDKEKLNKAKPPTFLAKQQKNLILCIEVAISPTQ
jgi:hypothetical protein